LIADHGDRYVSDVAQLFRSKAMDCIELMVKSWASKGQVDDPFSEFFIRCKGNVVVYSNWWHDCYFIAQGIVPATFSEELIDLMMSAGKALNFMRKFDEPVELCIDDSLPLSEFLKVAAREANGHILNLVMKNGLFESSIADIHNFMLLGRGDFASELLESRTIHPQVQILARKLVNRPIANITFREGDKEGFSFDAKPPLSAVIGPYELQAYKAVSALLVRIRRSIESARRFDRRDKLKQILFFEITNFLTLIYDFFQSQVILRSYVQLQRVLHDPQITFDRLLAEHTRHTSNIARGCWVSKSGQECRESLIDILVLIDSTGDEPAAHVRAQLRERLFRFRTMLLGHHVSGRALVGALTNRFKHIFD
jgi:hypothetical protein